MDIAETEEFLQKRIPAGKEFLSRTINNADEFRQLDEDAERWGAYNEEWINLRLGYSEYLSYHMAKIHSEPDFDEVNMLRFHSDYYKRHVLAQIRKLESIAERLPLWDAEQKAAEQKAAAREAAAREAAAREAAAREAAAREAAKQKAHPLPDAPIFLVHGSDTDRAQLVARSVERATGHEVVILREQPSGGRTLIEKFEGHAQGASFAIVLITADDFGGPVNGASRPRGRQNVIFEMGYFYGQIGRQKVCVLLDTEVEQPSDMNGVAYVDFGADGKWKHELFREMQHAGFRVDWSRIP